MRWIVVAGVFLFLCSSAHAAAGGCPNEGLLRSRNSDTATEVTFINDTGGTVGLYWIDFQGARQLYGQIPPGQRALQPTFLTHPWIVVDEGGACLGVYRPARSPRTVHISGGGTEPATKTGWSPRTGEKASQYRVVGVASDDTLNLRSQPAHEAEILREIPHDATVITGTGRTKTVGGETWVEVIYDNAKGWVNARFLAEISRLTQATRPKAPNSAPPGIPGSPPSAPVAAGGDLSALDRKITFNVLDHVEYEPGNGRLVLMGHRDAGYATSGIPYLQYLATLLEHPSPQFSLEWTRESEARVAELRNRLGSDDEWRRLAGEWGRWIDDSEHVTPAGRYFMPLFGIQVPPAGQKMDKYQVLSGVFQAVGEQQASEIVAAFGALHRAMPNPGLPQLYGLFRAAGVYDLFVNDRSEMQAGRMTEHQVQVDVYRAMFKSFDRALNYSGQPTSTAFENALRRGQTPDAAMEAAISEFDRQFEGAYGQALRRLYRSKPEFQIPVTLINASLRDTLKVEPKFIGVDASTLLAKLLLDADVAAKKLLNAPELADKIPGYQTQVTHRLSRPGSRRSPHASTSRLWISVEQIDALRSGDGNILALGETKMRFNMRERGQDGRDLSNQRPGDYEALLTSLYDAFARAYSPVFHELREAAKLAYVAQWLKARNTAYRLPTTHLATWRAPATVPGVIFISWSADPSRPDIQTVSAIGGISLRVPPVGPGACVKFCDDKIPVDQRIKPISAIPPSAIVNLTEGANRSPEPSTNMIELVYSKIQNPFETYASAGTTPGSLPVAPPKSRPEFGPKAEADVKSKRKEEEECLHFHQSKVGYKKLSEDDNDKSMAKDASVLATGRAVSLPDLGEAKVCAVVWHFIQNPDQLHCGPDPQLAAMFRGSCRPAVDPIRLASKKHLGEWNYGKDGEAAVWKRVKGETGRADQNRLFTTLLGVREVDVVGHVSNMTRDARIQCLIHCPGGASVLPTSMRPN
jgi:hypothetical protein